MDWIIIAQKFCYCKRDPWREKMISQIERARARGGQMVMVIPLQILAYPIAARRGLGVDQPRNLVKSVTVE